MPWRTSRTILFVDDDPDEHALIAEAIEQCGVECYPKFVRDGDELVDYLEGRGRFGDRTEYPLPALVSLDLQLFPENGFDVMSKLRESSCIPYIVMSGSTDPLHVERAYLMGAKSYIVKPATFEELVETVAELAGYWFEVATLPANVGVPVECG